jgi:hypothetical protein
MKVFTNLALAWSATLFIEWEESPILTTIESIAHPVNQIEFPAVTIWDQFYNTFLSFLKLCQSQFECLFNSLRLYLKLK